MSPSNWHTAFGIHILTASGTACALLALMAAVERAWPVMFGWLGVALLIDGVDGPLARRYHVASLLPRWSGDTLDLVVDFLTYVFVPAFAIARSGMLPDVLAAPAGIAIVVSSALYFADRQMKTDENYFRGFPALWNAAAFYFILLSPLPWLAAVAVATLVVASFMPFRFVHPLRVAQGRLMNIGALIAWAVLALVALVRDMAPGIWVTTALCVIAFYFVSAGMVRRLIQADAA